MTCGSESLDILAAAHVPVKMVDIAEEHLGYGGGPAAAAYETDTRRVTKNRFGRIVDSNHLESVEPLSDILLFERCEAELVLLVDVAEHLVNLTGLHLAHVGHGVYASHVDGAYPFGGYAEFGESLFGITGWFLLGLHLWEEHDLAYGVLAGHEHDEAVDAYADARCGGHAILECAEEVLVDDHSLVVALVGETHLLFETLLLVDGVVELAISVGEFLAVDHKLETLGQARFGAVFLGEGRHLDRVVGYEGGLNVCAFAELAEHLVDEFAFAHGIVDLHFELTADVANLVLGLAFEVVARFLLYSLEDWEAAEWGAEADDVAIDLTLGFAIYGYAYSLEEMLGEGHHPVVVFVLDVELHACELGVVGTVHALVAEVLANLVYAFEAAYYEPLEIKLGGDAHVHIDVEGVEMGDEGAGRRATSDRLENGGLDLGIACAIEDGAESAEHCGTLQEYILHSLVDDEVDIALAVAQLGVVEGVVYDTVFLFDNWEWFEALGENREALRMDRDFACLGAEHETLDADEVAEVEEFLEYHVIEVGIVGWAYLVAGYVDLDASFGILELDERGLAHDAAAHHTTGYAHVALRRVVGEGVEYVGRESVGRVFGGRVGVDTHVA